MIIYWIRKILSSKLGLGVFSAASFFGLTLLVGQVSGKSEIVIIAVLSLLFGVFFSMSLHERMGILMINNTDKGQYDTQRKFYHLLKHEEIPETKVERKQYLEFLEKLEKVLQTALGRKNTIWLLLPLLAAIQIIMFTEGLSWMKLISIFLILALSLSYYSSRKQYQKIQRLKTRLT